MSYKASQKKIQTQKLHNSNPQLFNYDMAMGNFGDYSQLKFVLKDGKNNLFDNIIDDVGSYFEQNNIAWWGDNKLYPSGHILSSQIQCLNFLFALRKDKNTSLKLAQLFDEEINNVLPVIGDQDESFIAFEFVYENEKLINETDDGSQRGCFCTSIDAFIIAEKNGKKLLIPIEWKFTESYLKESNKALEIGKGKTRQTRYNQLIKNSTQLKSDFDLESSVYYYEPFYEFMRQTLLVEQMVKAGIADDYLHVVVIPSQNLDLLGNNYTCSTQDLKTTWNNCLNHQSKFKIIESKLVLNLIAQLPQYNKLSDYLKARYF